MSSAIIKSSSHHLISGMPCFRHHRTLADFPETTFNFLSPLESSFLSSVLYAISSPVTCTISSLVLFISTLNHTRNVVYGNQAPWMTQPRNHYGRLNALRNLSISLDISLNFFFLDCTFIIPPLYLLCIYSAKETQSPILWFFRN